MPTFSDQIMADITDHVRRLGGDFTAWCVGTARDWHNPVFESRQSEDKDDDLICHFVKARIIGPPTPWREFPAH